LIALVFLGACHYGMAVENCTAPIDGDDVKAAILAVLAALGLFEAARLFVRGGLLPVARRVRAALR
jgi:hypothetical protein